MTVKPYIALYAAVMIGGGTWMVYKTEFWKEGPWFRRQCRRVANLAKAGSAKTWEFVTGVEFPYNQSDGVVVRVPEWQQKKGN